MRTADRSLPLNDGTSLPAIGFGLYKVEPAEVAGVVEGALDAGYRLLDGAAYYGNEAATGAALAESGRRGELRIASKFWGEPEQSFDQVMRDFDRSASELRVEVLDLYLIHWPRPSKGRFVEVWRAFIELQAQGRVRTIGVANFNAHELTRLIDETGVAPALNQVETHPWLPQDELRAFHEAHGIVTQAWSPLGRGALLGDPVIVGLARERGVSPAQVVLRWHLERGGAAVPKSRNPERLRENIDLDGFEFGADALERLATLSRGVRTGTSPADRA